MRTPRQSRTGLANRAPSLGVAPILLLALIAGCTAPGSRKSLSDKSAAQTHWFTFGSKGSAPGMLNKPDGVALDQHGNIWVVDGKNHRISVFGPGGKHRFSFGSQGIGPGRFGRMDGIYLHGADVYVTDLSQQRLQVFDLKGKFHRFVEFTRDRTVVPVNPIALTIHGRELFVVDPYEGCIHVSTLSGTVNRQISQRGTGAADLLKPESITLDGQGRLWVADEGNHRIQIFERSGRHVTTIGPQITSKYFFSGHIEGMACDAGDLCYAVDETSGYVVAFNLAGKFRFYLGEGLGRGPKQLFSADGLAHDGKRKRIVVMDQGNHRVQVFPTRLGRHTSFPALARPEANTKPFVIAKVDNSPSRAIRALMPLARYFALQLKKQGFTGGKVVVVPDYKRLAKRMKQGSIHLFIGSAYATMLTAEDRTFTAISIGKKKGRWLYQSLIVVREDTGIRSVAELAGKTMASEDRFSTSTFILPRIMLERAGLQVVAADALTIPPRSVRIKFTKEELSALWWMTRKGLEGGFFADTDFEKIKNQTGLRILQRSVKIPRVIVSVPSGLASGQTATLRRILSHLNQSTHRVVLAPLKVSQFRPISPQELGHVLSLKDSVK